MSDITRKFDVKKLSDLFKKVNLMKRAMPDKEFIKLYKLVAGTN